MVKSNKAKKNLDEYVTAWMGSMPSIVVHTILFIAFLISPFIFHTSFESALLVLTTIVSLEAIYLALFIQISINRQAVALDEVSEDIEEIQEDV
jgi:low affinity Fe/Cu permease